MNILVDANIFFAVILNEPEKYKIIELTNNHGLVSPVILPYEIGNALSAMQKRNRLDKHEISKAFEIFSQIPVRLVEIDISKALQIATENDIYAYDAYYLEAANRLNLKILSLDKKMLSIASSLDISILEVE